MGSTNDSFITCGISFLISLISQGFCWNKKFKDNVSKKMEK